MSNIYFMCENCGIETNGITFVNGMKFCAKCYHQIFGKDNQQTEITQLKQQLAEKQKTIDEINKEFVQAIHDWKTLCAKKDKEIERLNTIKNNAIECADLFKVALSVRQKNLAIQKLEKVKDFILENTMLETETAAVLTYIYQQIKELKGEKDVED